MKKWLIAVFYLFLFIWGFTEREKIILWVNESHTGVMHLFIILLLSILIATIPIIPFILFGGLVGAKYGIILGLVINWLGMFMAAIIYYVLARYLLAGYFHNQMQKYNKINRLQSFMNNHLFLSIVLLRLIPIIPPFIIHIYSGVKPIPYYIYVQATALGLIPPMFLLAYGGRQLLTDLPQLLIVLTLYGITVLSVYLLYRVRMKNRLPLLKEQ